MLPLPMRLLPPALLLSLVTLAGCAPSHRLAEVDLAGRSVAVMAPIPPEPVVTGPFPYAHGEPPRRDPWGRTGRRFEEARAAQARVDSAAAMVDVPAAVARYALAGSAETLGYRTDDDPDAADFILDVRLRDFALRAGAYTRPVALLAEADVALIERDTDRVVWEERVEVRERVTAGTFGYEDDVGDLLTPRDLAALTTGQLAYGLERLAALAATEIIEELREDYRGSR